MKLPKIKYLFLAFGVILTILIMFNYQDKKVAKDFERFDKSLIAGKLSFVQEYSREATFRINGNPLTFKFSPVTDKQLNGSHIFNYFAAPGDSIYKPAYSDTLLLFKNGQVYRYTFQKPGEE